MRPERERRRPGQDAPANITTAPRLAGSRPVEEVLGRLDKVRRSGKGWTARCPAHEDRWPSLSVAEGRDGRVLLRDHAGCRVEDITHAIGLELSDLFPPREDDRPRRSRPRPRPHRFPRAVAEVLVESDSFAEAWTIASLLAPLPPALARQDILSAWYEIGARTDPRLVVETVRMIRAAARSRYQASTDDDAAMARSVRRLLSEAEREAAA